MRATWRGSRSPGKGGLVGKKEDEVYFEDVSTPEDLANQDENHPDQHIGRRLIEEEDSIEEDTDPQQKKGSNLGYNNMKVINDWMS